jgi:predicted phage tail protein
MKKKLLALVAIVALAVNVIAANLTLAWNPSPDDTGTNFVTYAIYQANGTSTNFTVVTNVGNKTTYTFTNIAPGAYKFYITALDVWNTQSDPSNTAAVPAPITPRPPSQPILYVIVGNKTNIVNLGQ